MACLAAVSLATVALATDRLNAVEGSRRLRQLAQRLAPLPETGSGITRDLGAIAIIEHDGSNYDAFEADGVTPNYAARAAVAQRFYQSHGDFYDFLVVFTNFEFDTRETLAFHNLIRNDVRGIGLPIVDNGPAFGSPGRLKGYVDMAAVSRYVRAPLSLDPADPGFTRTLNVLAHETAHQWLTEARFRDAAGRDSSDLLKGDGHWSYLLDSDASVMYGADWVGREDGRFIAARVQDAYFNLDLYLMGLLDAAKVTPFTLLRNPTVSSNGIPVEDVVVEAVPETVSIDQVLAAEGPRSPSFEAAPKSFRLGFVFLTRPGTEPAAEDLEAVERVRRFFAGHFFAQTRGVAIADTTLAEVPAGPPAGAPDLDKALAWLLAQQLPDGRWQDSAATAIRDTAEALVALVQTGHQAEGAYQHARGWAAAVEPTNLDFAARRGIAIAPTLDAAARTAAVGALLAHQNGDGGFGAWRGYESDALDTALALRALSALGNPADARVRRGLQALAALRSPIGGWAIVPGGETSTLVTAYALLAAQDWSAAPEAPALLSAGLGALLARQNPDHGFGESPSTPYASALALQVLLRSPAAPPDAVEGAIAWLQASQSANGSWGNSRFETSLVLGTLKGSVAANLVVPADELVVSPAAPQEGESVQVTARIRNVGRSGAGGSHVRLFDGDPRTGESLAETAVPPLAPNQEATVSFEYPTADRAGDRTLYVVADSGGEVSEAREDDNATSRAVHVEGLLADLVIGPGDVNVDPYPPEEGETAEISVRVSNHGLKTAVSSRLIVTDGSPQQGGRLLGQATIPPLSVGASVVVVVPWNTSGARGDHVLHAVANADFAVHESDPDNDEVAITVTVTDPLPPGPDLSVVSLILSPSHLTRLPESIGVDALVRNLGRDTASSTLALFDSAPPAAPLTQWTVNVPPRSSARFTATVPVTAAGDRTFTAVADPDDTLAERDEHNNRATALLRDPHNTFDLEVLDADLTPSATDLVVGETLSVTATVRNRGTAMATDIPVILGHSTDSGLAELARALVALSPGTEAPVTLTWTTSITGDPVPLTVRVDPFGLLTEISESNNTAGLPIRIRTSALSNLAVSGGDVTFQPDPPREGGAATVSAVVRNTSPVAAGPFRVRFHRGDPEAGGVLIAESTSLSLASLANATVTVEWSPVDVHGAQGLFVVADALGQVEEYDETDNKAFRPFSVLGLPDLVLTVGDVALAPRYPRAGEAVTVHATVRNLGGLSAEASVLRASEGQGSGTVIGDVAIPPLAPGAAATLNLQWIPASPAGERTLVLVADADQQVPEQDEGNNLARRSVVVQDADLFVTEAYFSPDGDGVRDETSLAYRATGTVTVVVSNERNQRVRTLASNAPASGVLPWDGRDDHGRLLEDAAYTFTVMGEGGAILGRATAVADTNRRAIYDAAGTGLVATSNLSCALPDGLRGPVFMPSEDTALFLIKIASEGFPLGLVRVGLDGSYEYVAQDPWYADASFPVPAPDFHTRSVPAQVVSPDGRELLLARDGDLYAIDLLSGARRLLRQALPYGQWSPDGRGITGQNLVVSRDGAVVGELPESRNIFDLGWVWSPDSQFLAAGNRIVRRDGTGLRTIPKPESHESEVALDTVWRRDGKIFAHFGVCGDGCGGLGAWVLDPETDTATELSWLAQIGTNGWSPDGSKVLYTAPGSIATVAREDGSSPLRLLPFEVAVAPRGATAAYWDQRSVAQSATCNGVRTSDVFAGTSLQNLSADFVPTRLPGNNGILVWGTASDRNLDHYQLEYAGQDAPEVWLPLGPASEIPVVDDVLAVWVPPAPGSYLLRLRVEDRAGNTRSRTRLVAWDRFPVIANITQDEFLISPNQDDVKDKVTFNYVVMEPTRVDVRVVGPVRAGTETPPPPTVTTFSVEHPTIGSGSFVWDGRDGSGAVLPDGRYTLLINDLPFRVELDATPPDIAFAEGDLRTELVREPLDACGPDLAPQGMVRAERRWHVVDDHLKGWSLGRHGSSDPVYEPERDDRGQIVYDEDGAPRVSRINGRAVDRRDRFGVVGGHDPDTQLSAEDYAGNRSTVAVVPVEESLRILDARAQKCSLEATMLPPVEPTKPIHALTVSTFFRLADTIQVDGEGLTIRFQHQPIAGGAWTDAPPFPGGRGFSTWEVNFIQLGLQLGTEYRGRFVTESRGRTFSSEEFLFRPCDEYLALQLGSEKPVPGSELADYPVELVSAVHEPLARVRLTVTTLDADGRRAGFETTVMMDRVDSATFRKTVRAPRASCDGVRLGFSAQVFGESGREYKNDNTCAKLGLMVPQTCPCRLGVRQQFGFCDGSPSVIGLRYSADSVFDDARLRIERGSEDAPVVMAELPLGLERETLLDTSGVPEGILPLHARIVVPGDPERTCASVRLDALVDRTPPSLSMLEPVEGAQICGTPDPVTGHEVVRLSVQPGDFGREVALDAAEFRVGAGDWRSFVPSCPGTAPGSLCPRSLPTGRLSLRGWNIMGLPEGDLAVRLKVCDQAGNASASVRNVSIGREPPALTLVGTSPPIFSPNDDGRNDETTIRVRTLQTLRLTVQVRQAADTGPVVRTLASDQQFLPGDLPFAWDGRATGGQVVPDGPYFVVVAAADACGRGASLPAGVLVDNAPPTAVITRPGPGEGVRASLDVRGAAADAHFLSYELSYGPGADPAAWTLVGTGAGEISRLDGLLGRWDTPSVEGAYTLRLRALDVAGNEASALVTVNVGRRIYLDRLVASPAVFSPNGDGRRETTTLEYSLVVPGRVSLQVRLADGTLLRTLENGTVHDAGTQAFVWDGQTDGGLATPEGELAAWVRVEDLAGTVAPQEEAVSLVLDRTSPLINLERPPPESFVTRSSAVHGSISDPRLASYAVQAAPLGGSTVDLARGAQARSDEVLAQLAALVDGSYRLWVTAEDTAENRSRVEVPITIDSVPPGVAFEAPAGGTVLFKGTTPIEVWGRVAEEHLEAWTLGYGPGSEPATLTEIARSVTGGSSIRLASWAVASLPDGPYTLVLEATDRAAQHGQARLSVVLDGQAPDAEISLPADGAAISHEIGITGTARDANLDSWQLESAPGVPATAFQWSPVTSGTSGVVGGTLGSWSPLPPDGVHTLRLTVRDKVGRSATAAATVTIDTGPPAAPTGLAAEVLRTSEPIADVRLTWNANTEPDLAGYRVSRDGMELTPGIPEPRFADIGRSEGVYHYSVVAIDRAGNVSGPARVTVRLDLTAPVADIQLPTANASLSGSTDVRGTAFSVEDFKEYRLLVGDGTSPSTWKQLRRSTVPVAAGVLGNWTAVGDGPYVLALEAEDVSGNLARVTRNVFVDNQPPGAPVLTSVENAPDPDSLRATWTASLSSDAIGYLVYRNGHIANAPGIVTGSLRTYRVPGLTYVDASLPDGRHCHRIVTMDGAENLSPPSNELCRDLDNRAPQAVILQPASGTRFQYPIRIVAGAVDRDLASIQFQVRASDAPAWQDLGPADSVEPYETTLDPAGLSFGDLDLRAVATDRGGRRDAEAASITVTYGDATPPPRPTDLAAHVDGYDVQLAWSMVIAPDLAGYNLYRDQQLIAHVPASEPTAFADLGVALGPHRYEVTAADEDGNESAPDDAEALVYALVLDFVFPVTTEAAVTLTGRGSHEGTTVRVLRESAPVAEAAGTEGEFEVPGVPLVSGGNVLVARGHDAGDNRSVSSNESVHIRNDRPSAVTGLTATVDGHGVSLSWDPVTDPDLFGYVVRRGLDLLTASSLQTAASIAASDTRGPFIPEWAFDENPSTAWLPNPGALPATWSADFAAPILVDRITIRFLGFGSDPVVTYRIEARWEDRFVPLFRQTAEASDVVDHALPTPFATDGLRVVLEEGRFVGLAEVTISKRHLVPAGLPTFADASVPDGFPRYEVAAVDRYGAEGEPADVQVTVGDVAPPAAPTGLTAVAEGRDVVLSWSANPEPDLAHYVLIRDGGRIATTAATTYRDPGLHNGDYRYTVLATDAVDNESPESDPAFATIDAAPIPPAAPAILFPTDAANPITADATVTDVRGRADPGSLVSLELNGALTAITAAEPGFVELGRVAAPPTLWVESADVSGDGSTLAFEVFDQETERTFIRVTDVAGGHSQDIDDPAYDGLRLLGLSHDGKRLAYLALRFSGDGTQQLFSADLESGARTLIDGGSPRTDTAAWSPDGSRIAFVTLTDDEYRLHARDLTTGATSLLATAANPLYFLRWSPDATRIAGQTYNGDEFELRIFDTASGAMALVPDQVAFTQAGWSPDSRRLAYTSAAAPHLRIAIYDLDHGTVAPVTEESSDAFDPRFDRDGNWLSFGRVQESDQDTGAETVVARRIDTGEERSLGRSEGGVAFRLHEWVDGSRLAAVIGKDVMLLAPADGFFDMKDIRLAPGDNVLVARATDPLTGAAGPDSQPVHVTVGPSRFADLAVTAADLTSYPAVPAIGQGVRLAAAVHNLGGTAAEQIAVTLRLLSPTGTVAFETSATVSEIASGGSAIVAGFWTPPASGTYLLQAIADPAGAIVEIDEDNNEASMGVWVVAASGLAVTVDSDRIAYPARASALLRVRMTNGGSLFDGLLRTTVEDAGGQVVALLDERSVTLDFGRAVDFSIPWSAGTTYAGAYTFRVQALAGGGSVAGSAQRSFSILPDISLTSRLVAERATVDTAEPARFDARLQNRGANAALEDLLGRLLILPEGSAHPIFQTEVPIPRLLPGAIWETSLTWPSAAPAGRYTAELLVLQAGATLTIAQTSMTVSPADLALSGRIALDKPAVLAGAGFNAEIAITNSGRSAVASLPIRVEVLSGADATVIATVGLTVDLAAGARHTATLPFTSAGIAPGAYPVFLRAGVPTHTLDRATLRVHGTITAPAVDSPSDGATVPTSHPTLVVNNASSTPSVPLTYEFQVYADAALTQPLPGASGIAEGPGRTAWTVVVTLGEDRTYFWRARASDGFSPSPWTPAAQLTIDTRNLPPSAPLPDTPFAGARVASREPTLTVSNAHDPELNPLTYEFRLGTDSLLSTVVASATAVPPGPGLTSWAVPLTLEENAIYYWSARATDGHGFSAWSVPISFLVDTLNESPSAPTPIAPVGAVDVPTLTPEMVVGNASDPEDDALTYSFEVDGVPSFDSPALQVSPPIAEGSGRTSWTPAALSDNTAHYWRASASDGNTAGPWAGGSFFVNLANDPPGVPSLVDPVDGRTVTTATPTLRLANTTDLDHDTLTYEFEVRNAAGMVVAAATGVAEGTGDTAWTVPMDLAEDASFTWTARATDDEAAGPWAPPASFRVNVLPSPPTAPTLVAPAEGSTVDVRGPTLVVANATSHEGLPLSYRFELYALDDAGALTLLAQVSGVPEGAATTSWVPSIDLADGDYAWSARAVDSLLQAGAWMTTAHFKVLVDVPPAAPSSVRATPGDHRVLLSWDASPESDVTGYRIYRAGSAGGPYEFIAARAMPSYVDNGLPNGITFRYVVTAVDARFESPYSAEVAATPMAPPPDVILAQIRLTPATIDGECLVAETDDDHPHQPGPDVLPNHDDGDDDDGGHDGDDDDDDHDDDDDDDDDDEHDGCPRWVYASIELPAGFNPASIERSTVRLAGSIRPESSYVSFVDDDGDGLRELKLRFAFRDVRARLAVGTNVLRVTGRAAGKEFRGDGTLHVTAPAADLWFTPRTLNRNSQGDPVHAKLTFHADVTACDVSLASLRLNDTVPAQRKVSCEGRRITVKFDRAAVIAVLPAGEHVEVRVKGTIHGVAFTARDFMRVIP